MPTNAWTPEQAKEMSKKAVHSRKQHNKLVKQALKLQSREQWMDFLKRVLANPAVIGSAAFIAVYEGWQPGSGMALFNLFGLKVPNPVQTIQSTISKDVLLAAIAFYVASGGNLAGTLQSGADVITSIGKLIPNAGTALAGAAAVA